MHLNSAGMPQHEIIEKIHNEPGFTIRYALEEYMKTREMSITKK
jgi:hypothetical protein